MSLPTPNTRKEQYLNAIATGNAGGLPTPITREEEYLEAIAKGGGSGDGDMKKSVYDSDLDVAGAGGIKAFVNSAVAGKVDKVEGKGLSTNDYDNTEKAEVAKVAGKAEKTATASGEALALAPTSEGKALIHTVYGMSVQNGTPTPSVPVDIESAKADFRSVGKNLIPYPYYETTHTENGVNFTDNEDGTITVDTDGSASTGVATFFCQTPKVLSNLIKLDKNKTYIFSDTTHSGVANNSAVGIRYFAEGVVPSTSTGTAKGCNGSNDWQVTVTNAVYAYVYVYVWRDKTVSNLTFKPMLRLADVTDNTYSPYIKTDLTTDLTLRAIEVSSTDNYNLEKDGKYYIADTLDYSEDNGFAVTRRVGAYKFDGSESWTLPTDRITQYGYSFRILNYGEVLTGIKAVTGNVFDLVTDKFRCFSLIGGPYIYSSNTTADWGSGTYRTSGNLWVSMGAADMSAAGVTDLTSFQTWLSNNNIDILYPIIPTTENITTEQALALLSLKTYDESTSILSQAEPSCTVAIEYAKERLGALALIAHNLAKGNDLRIAELEETP